MRRTLPFFVALLLIAGVLVWWQGRAARVGKMSAPSSAMFTLLRPGQKLVLAIGGWFGDVGKAMFRRGDIISENEKLQTRVADLESRNARLQRYRRENEELKALLKMSKPPGANPIAAQIVSYDAADYAQRIFVNVGARQGVQKKDIVFSSHGVVGQVVNSSSDVLPIPTSEVWLLTDRRSGVGAAIARTGAVGVVQGTGGALCRLEYLDYFADVRVGDTVLTSGLVVKEGGVYPKGLVIGRVIKVERNKTLSRLSAYVDPAVPFDQITTVWVRAGANK
jgi:rod shape-determining protein MreC